jgi:hypothetical protein
MTSYGDLWVVLLGFYLFDSLVLLGPGASLLMEQPSGRFRASRRALRLGAVERSLALRALLPWRANLELAAAAALGPAEAGQLGAVRERWRELQRVGGPVRRAGASVTALGFVGLPVVLALAPRPIWLMTLAAGVWVGMATTFALLLRAHRRLFPSRTHERWTAALPCLLLPTSAMRAYDALARHVFAGHPPLLVAALLLEPVAAEARLARRERELAWPTRDELATGDASARRAELAALTRLRQQIALPPTASPPAEPHCPRCLERYVAAAGECPDCPGVAITAVRP